MIKLFPLQFRTKKNYFGQIGLCNNLVVQSCTKKIVCYFFQSSLETKKSTRPNERCELFINLVNRLDARYPITMQFDRVFESRIVYRFVTRVSWINNRCHSQSVKLSAPSTPHTYIRAKGRKKSSVDGNQSSIKRWKRSLTIFDKKMFLS